MEDISTTHDATLKSLLFPILQATHLLNLNQAKLSQLVDRRGLLGVRIRRALRLSSATFINAHLKMTRIVHRTHSESAQVEKRRNPDLWLVHDTWSCQPSIILSPLCGYKMTRALTTLEQWIKQQEQQKCICSLRKTGEARKRERDL